MTTQRQLLNSGSINITVNGESWKNSLDPKGNITETIDGMEFAIINRGYGGNTVIIEPENESRIISLKVPLLVTSKALKDLRDLHRKNIHRLVCEYRDSVKIISSPVCTYMIGDESMLMQPGDTPSVEVTLTFSNPKVERKNTEII